MADKRTEGGGAATAATKEKLAPYRELTIAGTMVGVVIGVIMTAAFVYIALRLGFGLSGSTVAAILGFLVLRVLMGRGTIVENNINQTIASGINNASSGIAFTLPVLFLMSLTNPDVADFSPWPIVAAALAGSFMGIVLIIPLRKQMIEFERLRFPSGIAVASLLRSPGAGAEQGVLLIIGFVIAAIFHVFAHLFPAQLEMLDVGAMLDVPPWFPIAVYGSFASFGAGLLSGRGGMPFVLGALLAWWVISPVAVSLGWVPVLDESLVAVDPATYDGWRAGAVYSTMLRPLGIGVLIGGALSGVLMSLPALKSALKSLSSAAQTRGVGGGKSEELSTRVLYLGLGASVFALFAAALFATDNVTLLQAIGVAVVGTIWLALAGLIVAQATGRTDISPLSGLSLIAVTLMFFMTGGNVVASVMLGVAVCIGIGQCADMMTDLKSGHMIGAVPRRQQLAQFAVAWIGVPVAIGVLYILWGPQGGGFGAETALPAPQAGALQGILDSLASGDAAIDKYAAGAGIGLSLGAAPVGGLGVLVGLAMYLPFGITVTYGLGCLTAMALQKARGARWLGAVVVPVSTGFIVGEALTSLTLVIIDLVRQ